MFIRKLLILPIVCLLHLSVSAQETTPLPVLIGHISYNKIFQQMPEYAEAQQKFQALKAKYDAEATRAEAEFQRKFSEFLQGQKDFPTSIMRKRQTELQELMTSSINFRTQAQQLLADAERELQQPVRERLDQAIKSVATRLRLIIVVNTDTNATPFLDSEVCVDIYEDVLQELGLESPIKQ